MKEIVHAAIISVCPVSKPALAVVHVIIKPSMD